MRRLFIGSAPFLAVCALSFPAQAFQPPADDEDDLVLEDEDEMNAVPAPPAGGAEGDAKVDTNFLDDPSEATSEVGGTTGGSDDGNVPKVTEEQQREMDERDITIVQQQAFLNVYNARDPETGKQARVHRFELMPQIGLSVNDAFVRHFTAGAEFNYWLTNRMAIGVNANAFFGAKTPNYDRIRFQDGLLLTANKYLWQASLAWLYEPFYGKIALFNKALLHWEAYVQLGGGVIHTKTIPRFASVHDPFDNILGQANIAIGSRYYVKGLDFMSFNFGVRTWGFFDVYEPQERGVASGAAAGSGASNVVIDNPALNDPEAAKKWSKENSDMGDRLAFNTVFFVGVSFYLPPAFEYSTRR